MSRRAGIHERLHDRFELPAWCGISASIAGQRCRVTSLGYGGIGLEVPARRGREQKFSEGEMPVELEVFEKRVECPAEVRFQSAAQVGMQFTYKSLGRLEELRQIISWLAFGAKLVKSHNPDIRLACDERRDGRVALKLEFKVGSVSCELRFKDETIETWHDLGAGGELVELQPTEFVDATVYRCGMLIILGILASQKAGDVILERAAEAMVVAFAAASRPAIASAS